MKKRNLFTYMYKLTILPVVLVALLLGGCPQPTDDTVAAGPTLAAKDSQLAINQEDRTLTVGFSEAVKITDAAQVKNQIEVHKEGTELAADKIESIALKQDDATKMVITLNDPILRNEDFKVVITAEAITDLSGNKPAENLETEILSISPDRVAPALAAEDSLAIDQGVRTLTVVFSEEVKITNAATIKTRIKVHKEGTELAADKIARIALKKDDAKKIVITLIDPILRNDAFSVVVNKDAITDQNDNKPAGTLTTETKSISTDRVAPALAALGSQLAIDDTARTLTVVFSEPVKLTDAATIKTRIKVHKEGTELTADKIDKIAVKEGDAEKIVITLSDPILRNEEFKVVIPVNAITDQNDNKPAKLLTTETLSISPDRVAPALAALGSQLVVDDTAKTLTVTFSEQVKITNAATIKNQIEVHKRSTKLDASKITSIVVKQGDATRMVITLVDVFGKHDKFKVVIPVNAITDLNDNKPAGTLPTETLSADTTAPVLAAKGPQFAILRGARSLMVYFSEAITIKDPAGIVVKKNGSSLSSGDITSKTATDYGAGAGNDKIQIGLKTEPEAGYALQVIFEAGAVEDLSGNLNIKLETEIESDAPQLAAGEDVLTVRTGSKTLEIEFNQPLKAIDASKIKVYKTPAGETEIDAEAAVLPDKIKSIGLKTGDATRVQIVLADAMAKGDKYQVYFLKDAVTGMNDKKNSGELNTEADTLLFLDSTAPTLAGNVMAGKKNDMTLESDPAYKFGLGLQVYFSEYIARFDASQIEVYFDGATDPLDASDIETVYLSALNQLTVVLKKASSAHASYQVKFKPNAVFDVADNGNADTLETETETLGFMVKDMTVKASTKTLTLYFSKDITNPGTVKSYAVYKNSADVSVEPASVGLVGGDVVLSLGGTVEASDRFYVKISSHEVTAAGGGKNAVDLETGAVSEGAVTDTMAPKLKSSGNIFVKYDTTNLILELDFDEPLSVSHRSLNTNLVVGLDGGALLPTTVQSFFQSGSKKLSVVLKPGPGAIRHGEYRVLVRPGLVKDVAGNANDGRTQSEKSSAVHFVPTGYTLDSGANTLTLSFSKAIAGEARPGAIILKKKAGSNYNRVGSRTVRIVNGKLVIGIISVASGDVFELTIPEGTIETDDSTEKNMHIIIRRMVAP